MADAGARIFFESEFDCLDIEQVTRANVKNAMDRGAFNQLDDRIVNVTYVEKSDLGLSEIEDVVAGSDTSSSADESSFPLYAWVLIALGAILFVLSLGLVYKNFRQYKHRSRRVDLLVVDPTSWTSCVDIESPPRQYEEERLWTIDEYYA